MIDSRDTQRAKHERDEFTAKEITAYTGLNLPARRVPCWLRIRNMQATGSAQAVRHDDEETGCAGAIGTREKCTGRPLRALRKATDLTGV